MTAARYDVIGIGNAIVDIIGRCDEAYLATIGASKGSMRLVGADDVKNIYATMGSAVEVSGGGHHAASSWSICSITQASILVE